MNRHVKIIIIFLFFLYVPYINLSAEEYVIRYLGELEELRASIQDGNTYLGDTIVIAEDLDFESRYFPGLGDSENIFEGTIEGRGNKILNYNSDYPFVYTLGKNGTIKNLIIASGTIADNTELSAFVYRNYGRIENCENFSSIIAEENVAGICLFNRGVIVKCYNAGNLKVKSKNQYLKSGGIVAENFADIYMSYNEGNIYGYSIIGGIAGYSENGRIDRCYNSGDIEGFIAAGIIGYVTNSSIKNTYNIGTITVRTSGSYIGGIFGFSVNSSVSYSFNVGQISCPKTAYVGSVGGYRENSNFEECLYLSGAAAGIGNEYVDTGNYGLGNIIGNAMLKSMSGVKSIKNEDFANKKIFEKWNLGKIWGMSRRGYPYLIGVEE